MTLCPDTPGVLGMFETGSRVYGTPRPDSDHDVVVWCTHPLASRLCSEFGGGDAAAGGSGGDQSFSLYHGSLNYIVLTDRSQFEAWKLAKLQCVERAPITRELAVAIHKGAGVR